MIQWLYPRTPVHTWTLPGLWYDIGSKETLEEANYVFSSTFEAFPAHDIRRVQPVELATIPLIAAFSIAPLWGADAPLSPESSTIPLSLNLATLHHLEVLEASEACLVPAQHRLRSLCDPQTLARSNGGRSTGRAEFETFFVLRGWMIWRFSLGHPSRPLSPGMGPLIKAEAWMPVAIDLPFESDQRWDPTRHHLLQLDPGRQEGALANSQTRPARGQPCRNC